MPLPRSKGWLSGLRPTKQLGTNPKDDYGSAKTPLSCIPVTALVVESICMQDGVEKYGPFNYRAARVQYLIYLEAALRHIQAFIDGEEFDPQTGKPHLGYGRACLGIVIDSWVSGYGIDNRPLPGKGGELISYYNNTPGAPERTPTELREGLLAIIERNRKGFEDAQGATEGGRPGIHNDATIESAHRPKRSRGKSRRNSKKQLVKRTRPR